METYTDTKQGVGTELLADAKGVGSSAANRLFSEVDNRKGAAATQAKSLSSAIESAGDGLDSDSPAWLKSAFTQGSQQVQKFADMLEQKDSRQLVSDVSAFARTSPMTFLAACAAAGFAASRIFQAGAKGNTPGQQAPIGRGSDMGLAGGQAASSGQGASSSQPDLAGQFATTNRYDSSSQSTAPVGGQFA